MNIKKIFKIMLLIITFILVGCNNSSHIHEYVDGKCECGDVKVETYTVIFKDYDGKVISQIIVEKNKDAQAPQVPNREGYKFIGWNKSFTNIQENIEVVACYEKIIKEVKTSEEWLEEIKFGINYFNGINENNDDDAYFKWIKSEGFNAVEIGCRYPHLVDSIYGDLNEEKVSKLKQIIDYAYKYDLYIILSLYDGNDYMWTSLNSNNQESILKMIDTSYRKLVTELNIYDDKLAISFCSEPRDYTDNLVDIEDIKVLNNINEAFVKMVRSTGGNNLTRKLVITTGWSKCDGISGKNFKMIEDDYTMVRIHLYQPGNFSNSKTSDSIWLEEEYQLNLLNYFQEIKANFIDKKIPVYIGEFGARPKDNDEERNKWAQCYLSMANSYNIKCFIWDTENKGSGIANSYAISDKEKLKWLNPEFMNYVLNLVNDNYIPFYDTYNKIINIDDEIIINNEITNLLTNKKEYVNISYDESKVIMIDGKYYPKSSGKITFSYTINNYNYYYQYDVVGTKEEANFDLIIKTDDDGKIQCFITTKGYSTSRLDYNWSSTNQNIITISKYSTITIIGDGECSIIAENIETGDIGIIDIVITNGKISSAISRNSEK